MMINTLENPSNLADGRENIEQLEKPLKPLCLRVVSKPWLELREESLG